MFEIVLIAVLTFFTTIISAIAGFGTSTIMIPLLQLFLPAHETLILVGIIHWFNNIWRIAFFRTFNIRLILLFGTPSIIGAYLGARLAVITPSALLSQLLGVFLLGYIVVQINYPHFTIKKTVANTLIGGSLAGFSTGVFGIGGSIKSAFLTAFNTSHTVYISTLGVIGILVDSVRIPTYLSNGMDISHFTLLTLICSVPASFAATWTAKKIAKKFSQEQFRTIVIVLLAIASIKLIIWPISGN